MALSHIPWDPNYLSGIELPSVVMAEPSRESSAADGEVRETDSTEEPTTSGARKKNYQRYAKPPYSYLAMVAMVIRGSPEKRLKLSQILHDISDLFPFFKGEYQGWKDSIRHNLSSSDCFKKVLKDPMKPQAKGNYWIVDVGQIPADAMKLQNTNSTRQDIYPHDLAPYIMDGQPLQHFFELIHSRGSKDNTPTSAAAEPKPPALAEGSSVDPSVTFPMILWNLPTSYSKFVPPNVVAPPSIHPLMLYSDFPSAPLYNYMSNPYTDPIYQERAFPYSMQPHLPLPPRLAEIKNTSADLPPNKSVFDIPVYPTHPGYMAHHSIYGQHMAHGSATLPGYWPKGY